MYEDYDWITLYRDGKLRKLYSSEFDKYMNEHHMENCTGTVTKKQAAHQIMRLYEYHY